MNIRLKYKKTGDICYISHLDVIKLLERIIRRAKLKVGYSEGFNPHPKISFSPALQLGVQSLSEFVDITLDEEYELSHILKKMNESSVDGLEFIEGKILEGKVNSIVAFITHSKYEILIPKEEIEIKELEEVLNSINTKDEIMLTKKTKKGKIKEYNMKEFIGNIEITDSNDSIKLTLTVCSGSDKSINPKTVIEHIKNILDKDFDFELIKLEAFHIDEKDNKLYLI